MLRNYFKIAFRNLSRNKVFSFINIFGLAAGLVTCLLIMLYIFDERSYDKHHKDGDRIYRVASRGDQGNTWASAPAPMAFRLKSDLPEVEQATRLLTFPDIATMLMKYEQDGKSRQFFETNGYYVDSTFFDVLSYQFVFGKAGTALTRPGSLVISQTLSRKFFGNNDPVGRSLQLATPFGERSYTVTGVFDGQKSKSHIPANFFLSMRNNDMWNWVKDQTSWISNNIFFTYIKLRPGTNPSAVEKKLKPFFEGYGGADLKAAGHSITFFLQPVKDIYLHSSLGNELAANGNISYLYILGSIAAFILLIACINFMNLSTARSQKRAKEVGVRKVVGAEQKILIAQFLGESFFMSLIALALALVMAWLLLPVFNVLTGKDLHPFDKPVLVCWILGLTLLTGLLSGLYPAFYLSAFKPVSVLKGKIQNSFSATTIRKGLVIFQFTISICLVMGAIVIWKQMDLLKNQELGFDKKQKVILPLQQSYIGSEANYTALRNDLLKIPGIKAITSGSTYPGIPNLNDMPFYARGKKTQDAVDISLAAVDNDYIKTLGISLVNGRSFSNEFTADSAGIILNEAAVRKLGLDPATAPGKTIQYDFSRFHGALEIVGVMKDFNFESLHNEIKPCGFTTGTFASKYGYLIASLNSTDYSRLLKEIERSWVKLNPFVPFVYSFMDQDFQRNYEREQRTSQIVAYFTLIAILIACMGLFGLAAFSAEQRTKEIGIRKVLGASVPGIISLLSKEFIRLVVVALALAAPLAWYGMNRWLESFAYKTSISWWMFAVAGSLAILIAFITVSTQSIRAAFANPVRSLRTE